jgi:hypothetical protein
MNHTTQERLDGKGRTAKALAKDVPKKEAKVKEEKAEKMSRKALPRRDERIKGGAPPKE